MTLMMKHLLIAYVINLVYILIPIDADLAQCNAQDANCRRFCIPPNDITTCLNRCQYQYDACVSSIPSGSPTRSPTEYQEIPVRIKIVHDGTEDRYWRHSDWNLVTDPDDGTTLFDQDSTFLLREPSLYGSGSNYDLMSFQSSNYANYFIRHSAYELKLDAYLNTDLYKQDSSFYVVNALNGATNYVSFKSQNYQTHYIRHSDYKLFIEDDLNTDLGKDDASFLVICTDQNNCPTNKYTFLQNP